MGHDLQGYGRLRLCRWAGMGRFGPNYYLLDQVRRRMGFTASKAAVLAMLAQWPQVTAVLIEDKANGPAVLDALRGTGGTVLQSSLSHEDEAKLQAALNSARAAQKDAE